MSDADQVFDDFNYKVRQAVKSTLSPTSMYSAYCVRIAMAQDDMVSISGFSDKDQQYLIFKCVLYRNDYTKLVLDILDEIVREKNNV